LVIIFFTEQDLSDLLLANNNPDGGIIYAYHVQDPERYGVVDFDDEGNVLSIEEKPEKPNQIMRFLVFIFMIMMLLK
jgi:dTDP-glucose pyrophosphorylase